MMTHPFGSCYEDERRTELLSVLPWKHHQYRGGVTPHPPKCNAERSHCNHGRSNRAVCPGRKAGLILTKVHTGQRGLERAEPWRSRTLREEKGSRMRAKAQVWKAYVVARATITTYYRPGGLETTETYC